MFLRVRVCVDGLKSSLLGGSGGGRVSWELRVDKGEPLELVLVQVLNHFLVRWRQHRRMASEKSVKVLGLPSALLEEGGRRGWRAGGGEGGWIGMDGVGGEEEEEKKTKEGEWQVEPRCEMTSLENGFKY